MILLRSSDNDNLIVIIGIGLIGSALVQKLVKYKWLIQGQFKVVWGDPNFFKFNFFELISKNLNQPIGKVNFLWSAGKSGFNSGEAECLMENNHFRSFLESIETIVSKFNFEFQIHLISSAGALFEGQMGVNSFSVPSPRRPYGFSKLWQEHLLAVKFPRSYTLYRPSSVYGPVQTGKRVGLISKMVNSIQLNSEISIFGGMSTLRDFIWVDDVAKAIIENFDSSYNNGTSVIFLVSAKPTSILEVSNIIFKVTRRRLFYRFESRLDFSSMSFSNQVKSMYTISLETGIKLVYFNS